ncbi:putative leader peptide [Actinomadura kijaniata]|uniref:putative leader peptide n=1 Tax=Actinomadura kijaniata TaxID=46161 RepID=UPI003F1A020D
MSAGGRCVATGFGLAIVRRVNTVPPGGPGFSRAHPRLVRRLHVDLCRLASCLCPR